MKRCLKFFLLIIAVPAWAGQKHPEEWYQERWCKEQRGQAEVVLPDRTRCNCLTKTHAVEVDFGPKWAESIGQALYYGMQTGKRPGIVLILESLQDRTYWLRLNSTIELYKLPFDTWGVGVHYILKSVCQCQTRVSFFLGGHPFLLSIRYQL